MTSVALILLSRNQFGGSSNAYTESSASTQSASQSGRGTSMVSGCSDALRACSLIGTIVAGSAPQGGQCEAHERPSPDAALPDGRPGWIRTDLGVGPPAACLLAPYIRHLCQGDAVSLLGAGQQIWNRRWRRQAQSLAGGDRFAEQSFVHSELLCLLACNALHVFSSLSPSCRVTSATTSPCPTLYFSALAVSWLVVSLSGIIKSYLSVSLTRHPFAIAGQSSENKNINIWDTLLPNKKSCVSGK